MQIDQAQIGDFLSRVALATGLSSSHLERIVSGKDCVAAKNKKQDTLPGFCSTHGQKSEEHARKRTAW